MCGDLLSPSPFLLLGDHAGRAIPATLGDLGLEAADRERHIAVDVGVEDLGLRLGERLQAAFVYQAYSRLVVDCNRNPAHADAIPQVSDGTKIPGNMGLAAAARQARLAEIFHPYHQAIAAALDAREAASRETILVALHSFTPVMDGVPRRCQIGVLHNGKEDVFALAVLAHLRQQNRFFVAGNEPYAMDRTDYTVPLHAFARGLRYIELEIRQDLLQSRSASQLLELVDLLAAAFVASS